jgi:hypothetical protein
MANLVKYGAYDMETATQEEKANETKEYMKLEVGDNIVRILPPLVGKTSPFRVIWQHYIEVPGQEKSLSFVCPLKEARKPCPICAHADKLKVSGNPLDVDKAKSLFARRRVFANVIDRKNPDAGPKVLAFGRQIHDELIMIRKDARRGGDFTHPEQGFDICINRRGTGKNDTKYRVAIDEVQPLGNIEWIDQQYDLESFAKVLSAKEIMEAIEAATVGQAPEQRQVRRPQQMDAETSASRKPRGPTVLDSLGNEVDDAGQPDGFPL